MPPRKTYFHVQCDRCGQFAEAVHSEAGKPSPPFGWQTRNVIATWAMGAVPDEVLLCRNCTETVDTRMSRAWRDAIAKEPEHGDAP